MADARTADVAMASEEGTTPYREASSDIHNISQRVLI